MLFNNIDDFLLESGLDYLLEDQLPASASPANNNQQNDNQSSSKGGDNFDLDDDDDDASNDTPNTQSSDTEPSDDPDDSDNDGDNFNLDDDDDDDTSDSNGDDSAQSDDNTDDNESGEDTDNNSGSGDGDNFDLDDDDSSGTDDNASDDSSDQPDTSSSTDDPKTKLKELEASIFDQLPEAQKVAKIKELKTLYTNVHAKCGELISSISDMPKDPNKVKVYDYVINSLTDLQKYITDYLSNIFDSKSYIENLTEFQKYLTILDTINNVFSELNLDLNKDAKK